MASLTPAMAAWWHSGVAEKVEGDFFGHGEITHMLPTYANMPTLPVERITACSSSAWTMARRGGASHGGATELQLLTALIGLTRARGSLRMLTSMC